MGWGQAEKEGAQVPALSGQVFLVIQQIMHIPFASSANPSLLLDRRHSGV